MHEVLVNRLGGLSLPRKSVGRLTERPNMTLGVYRGHKTTILHTKFQSNIPSHFGEMDLNGWVDVNFFRVEVNFQTAIVI